MSQSVCIDRIKKLNSDLILANLLLNKSDDELKAAKEMDYVNQQHDISLKSGRELIRLLGPNPKLMSSPVVGDRNRLNWMINDRTNALAKYGKMLRK